MKFYNKSSEILRKNKEKGGCEMKSKKMTYTSLCAVVISSTMLLGGCVQTSEPFDMSLKKLSKNLDAATESLLGFGDVFNEDEFEIEKNIATFEVEDDLYLDVALTKDDKVQSVTVRLDDANEDDLGEGFINLAGVTMFALDKELNEEGLIENIYYLIEMDVEHLLETGDTEDVYSYDEDRELVRNEVRYELTMDDEDTLRLLATRTDEEDTENIEGFDDIIYSNLGLDKELIESLSSFIEESFGEDATINDLHTDGKGAGVAVIGKGETESKEEETTKKDESNNASSSSSSTSSVAKKSSPSNPGKVGEPVLATIKNYKTSSLADVEITLDKVVRGEEAIKIVDKYNAQDNVSTIDYSDLVEGKTELMVLEYTVEVVSDEPSDSYFSTYSTYLKDLDGESSAEGNGYSFWSGAWSINDSNNYPNLKVGKPATYRVVLSAPTGVDDFLIKLEQYENETDAYFSLK